MKRNILFLIGVIIPLFTYAQKPQSVDLNIVYIGNSITQGVMLESPLVEAPGAQACQWLRLQPEMKTVKNSNQGVSGSTTVDFLPISGTLFQRVILATDTLKETTSTLLFSIMLGTNDSAINGPNGAPVSPQQYHTNMKVIIDELLRLYPQCMVVLNRPLWYSPNTYNSAMYLKEGLGRVEKYFPQLEALVSSYAKTHPQKVFMGDTDAFEYFKTNYLTAFVAEPGNAGTFYLHPTKDGAVKLGEFWGKAIYKVIKNYHCPEKPL